MRLVVIPLFAVLASWLTGILSAEETGGDFVAEIKQHLPSDWKVELHQRGVFITSPPMDVVSSARSSGDAGVTKRPLQIAIRLTPRYSPAMLKRVDVHNAAIEAELDPDRRTKTAVAEMVSRQIVRPRYHDANYGFDIGYPSYCPAHDSDSAKVRKLISGIGKDWKAYDDIKTNVVDDITAQLLDGS